MVLRAVAAFVDQRDAFVGVVVPSLALKASCQLFLNLCHPNLLVANAEAAGEGPVGREGVSKGYEKVCRLLLMSSPRDGFHPTN